MSAVYGPLGILPGEIRLCVGRDSDSSEDVCADLRTVRRRVDR